MQMWWAIYGIKIDIDFEKTINIPNNVFLMVKICQWKRYITFVPNPVSPVLGSLINIGKMLLLLQPHR